jgi:2-hydroxychromene-2-carboxylate isomerase
VARIDYFFSLLSPYSYLAGTRLEDIAARHGAAVGYRPFDLMTLAGRLGAPKPEDRPQGRKDYRLQDLRRTAGKIGLPITLRPMFWPTNAAPAAYAVIAAQKAGGGDLGTLVHSLLRATWAEEKDIADDAVINACLKAAGFDPSLSFTGMLSGAEAYAANLEEAHARGVFGSPFYITDTDERFWGQDRLDDLDLHLAGRL